MADYNSSLPVRTQNNGDIKANISDGTTESILNTIKAASTAAVATDTALVVALSPNSPLPAGTAVIGSVTQGTTPWVDNLTQVGGSAIALGQATEAASFPVVIASNQSAIPVTQSTSPWITSDLADGSVSGGAAGTKSLLAGGIYNSTAPTLTTGQQASLQLDSSGNLKVDLATPIPAGTNAIGSVLANLQVANAAVTTSNPVPVIITTSTPGTPVQSYNTSASLAAGSSVTFTYTVAAAHTFTLERVWSSASGKIKSVVQNNGSTIFVGFNSTANPNIDITLMTPPVVATGNTVTVTITNLDLLPFDVYATIEGNQN